MKSSWHVPGAFLYLNGMAQRGYFVQKCPLSPFSPALVPFLGSLSPLLLKISLFFDSFAPHHKSKTPCSEKCTFLNKGFFYFCRVCVPFPTAFITTFRSLHLKHNTFFLFFFYFQAPSLFPLFCSEMYTFLNKTGLLQTGRFVKC